MSIITERRQPPVPLETAVENLTTEQKIQLVKALRYYSKTSTYASQEFWDEFGNEPVEDSKPIEQDRGKRARDALREVGVA